MYRANKFLLVETSALPEVFQKVVYAKHLLARGKARSLSEATKMADLSRSAFYKYKDSVFAYENDPSRQIATISVELMDEAGVLSSLLGELGTAGVNILTINQNIPVDGVAPVSISMRTDQMKITMDELMERLQNLSGVVNIRLLAS